MYGFLLVFFSNFVPKTHRFWDIRLVPWQWPWNPALGSLKVIENDTIRSGTHEFILTFHSKHRPISHHFRDKRRFPSKIANFPTPCILYPCWRVYPWNCISTQESEETRMMGLPDCGKRFKIDLILDTIPPCDSQPPSQPCCCSKYRGTCYSNMAMLHVAQATRSSADADKSARRV